MAKDVESILNNTENDFIISLKLEKRQIFNNTLVTSNDSCHCGLRCPYISSLDNALTDRLARPTKDFSDFDQNNNVVNYHKVKKNETEEIIFPPTEMELYRVAHKDKLLKVSPNMEEVLQQIDNLFECRGDCHSLRSHVTPEVTNSKLDFETDGPVSGSSSPRHPEYRDKNNRLISFTTWGHERLQDPHKLTNYGFFYTGEGDLVRCFYCGLGLKDFIATDDALLEHVRYSNLCPYLLELLGQKVLDDFKAKVIAESVRQEQQPKTSDPGIPKSVLATSVSRLTPRCRHPEYRTIGVRLASFSGWPKELTQTPQNVAEAGFYYTGKTDVVRCFFCDGGLQRWDPTDDPWIEHCRWFPTCEFVREMKGDSYVEQVRYYCQSRTNQQARAQVPEQSTNTHCVENLQSPMAKMSMGTQATPTLPRKVTQVENIEETNTKPIWRTSAAELVLKMGFKEHEVKQAVQQLWTERKTESPELIIEVIENLKKNTENRSAVISRKAEDLLAENNRLKSMLICNGCNQREINMLFLPCQHHKFCTSCSEGMPHCPVCGKPILHKVKTYLS